MKNLYRFLILSTLLYGIPGLALTADEITKLLKTARADLPLKQVTKSDVPGMYEASLTGGTVLYVTKDGNYFIAGDLYKVNKDTFVNVSDTKRNLERKTIIDALDETDMLVYAPAKDKVKATVTVFTDIDCGYCRKLHQEVPELNRMGIAIRYLAYPRAGLNSESYNKAVSAWCADDPKTALTNAKAGKTIPQKTCDNPVAQHFLLGNELGVNGTPAVVYGDGTLQPGYTPAKVLAERLGVL